MRYASSSEENFSTPITGPKISSCAIRHVVAHAGEDGRLVEVAAIAVARSAERQLGALVLADAHVALDALELLGRHDRAHVGVRIEAAADADPARLLDDPAHDLVVDALVHEHPRAARADLP